MSRSNPIPIRKLLPPHLIDEHGTLIETVVILDVTEEETFEREITCVVCLSPPDSTVAVMACLHRFCSECFNRCLRKNIGSGSQKAQNECPICRVKLFSRRDGRRDENFDELLKFLTKRPNNIPTGEYIQISSNFYVDEIASSWVNNSTPSLDIDQQQQQGPTRSSKIDEKLEAAKYKAAYKEQVAKIMKRQQEFKLSSAYETFAQRSPIGNNSNNNNNNTKNNQSPREEGSATPLTFGSVGFSLQSIPNTSRAFPALKKPYLRTPLDFTVADLKTYLEKRESFLDSVAVFAPNYNQMRHEYKIFLKNEGDEVTDYDIIIIIIIIIIIWHVYSSIIIYICKLTL